MGLTKWIGSKLIVYLMVFIVFYIIGEMMGWTPKALKNIVSWFGANFGTITVLAISFMVFWILLKILNRPRRQPAA